MFVENNTSKSKYAFNEPPGHCMWAFGNPAHTSASEGTGSSYSSKQWTFERTSS